AGVLVQRDRGHFWGFPEFQWLHPDGEGAVLESLTAPRSATEAFASRLTRSIRTSPVSRACDERATLGPGETRNATRSAQSATPRSARRRPANRWSWCRDRHRSVS